MFFPFSRFASSHADFRGINFDNSIYVISIGPYGSSSSFGISLSLRGIFESQVTAQPTPMAKIIPVDSLLTDIYREPTLLLRLSYENSSIISHRLPFLERKAGEDILWCDPRLLDSLFSENE